MNGSHHQNPRPLTEGEREKKNGALVQGPA